MNQTEQEIIDHFGEQLYVIRLGFSVQFKLLLEKIESMDEAYKKLCKTLGVQPSSDKEEIRPLLKFPVTSTQTEKINRQG